MTVIVGVASGSRVLVGGDSAGVAGLDLTIRADAKVFKNGPFAMGFTTSFRMGQLLRYSFSPPSQPEGMDLSRFMATLFVDGVRACLKNGGFATKDREQEGGGTFIVGYRGNVFVIEGDYQVAESSHGFAAVGCGAQVALGSLWQTRTLKNPRLRVLGALRATEAFSAGVRGPFTVVTVP